MGFPVFSGSPVKGIGLACMMGSPGGYLAGGLTPFLAGDLVKLVLAAIAMPLVWRLLSRLK